jgi:NAD(P)-dependent dehydrogenase (short-subunit alcohol dehydrogenase family)
MQSSGGLTEAYRFQGKDAILSGPAGGIVGMVRTALAAGHGKVIGFDMGGTSTDVSHYAGEFERAFDTQVAGVRMRAPMMAIHTVAAGGGSIINFPSHLGLKGSEKPAYAAAKGGIMSFTQTLAAQYVGYNIRANAIAPAIVRTERSIARWENKDWLLSDNPSPAAKARITMQKLYPFSVGEPEHIAALAVFLGSDESRMVNGTTIAADGGRSTYLKISSD